MQQVQANLRLFQAQRDAVDRARGDVPRNVWLRHAVVEKLEHDGDAPWDETERRFLLLRAVLSPEQIIERLQREERGQQQRKEAT
jgi:hypothetical protein